MKEIKNKQMERYSLAHRLEEINIVKMFTLQ